MRTSTGIALWNGNKDNPQFLVVRPGPPLFDHIPDTAHIWEFPKGKVESGENQFKAAIREFGEETGIKIKTDEHVSLGSTMISSNSDGKPKNIVIFMVTGTGEEKWIKSNTFTWSQDGKEYPEITDGKWMSLPELKKYGRPYLEFFILKIQGYLDTL